MRVLWFIEGYSVPASRYRAIQLFPYLENHGIKIIAKVSRPEKYLPKTKNPLFFALAVLIKIINRLLQLPWIAWADIVIIQRELTPYGIGHLEQLICKLHPRVVFDYDDALEISYNMAHPLIRRLSNERSFQKLLGSISMIFAGNNTLAEYAKKFNQKVFIIPTVIDTDIYKAKITSHGAVVNIPTIGWMGTSGNADNLKMVLPALIKLRDKGYKFVFRIISDRLPKFIINEFPQTQFSLWAAEREISDLQNFDIGIMPLENNEWNKRKCGFKLIQYMSVGLATISSPVGVNAEIVKHEINGLSAKSPGDWHVMIEYLLDNPDKCLLYGKTARNTIEQKYSLTRWAPEVIKHIQDLGKQMNGS